MLHLAHLLSFILNCATSMHISFLHLGQNRGNFTKIVLKYTFVRVFPPQIGHRIHREPISLSLILKTSNCPLALRIVVWLYRGHFSSFMGSGSQRQVEVICLPVRFFVGQVVTYLFQTITNDVHISGIRIIGGFCGIVSQLK